MTALSADTDIPEKASAFSQLVGDFGGGAVDETADFYTGALLVFDPSDSKIKPGETATGLFALGRCEIGFAAGEAASVKVRSGTFRYANSAAADAIANDDAGKTCYIVDDATVALTDGSSTRSAAGKVVSVDSSGVWVAINPLV